ncbi:hypothetical protein AB0I35_14610 [Nocardia sp. NPDC050378]|uniref:hypothetical protein n=1 Tax=Nocardia sp. NPDC050378 TaxID=3155400 RepID=UPI0033C94BC1
MTLTRCQNWILQSLCTAAGTKPVTAADLAGRLGHNTARTEEYLGQLADMGLACAQPGAAGTRWRPSKAGQAIGTVL